MFSDSAHKEQLTHYLHHFLVATTGLVVAYLLFESITIWEIIIFYFFSFIPLIDEILYSSINYIKNIKCRDAINNFLVGNLTSSLYLLHNSRNFFTKLTLHNFAVYFSLWSLWYYLLIIDSAIPFYALCAIQTHLMYDIINDKWEFGTIEKWFWPFRHPLSS